ncbi:uncharacterized protein SEPMUDRAFT_121040 [Sphaerulina musiva SO2202]|uniref:Uncharacterized protein n=1 Tax=Sphaerulina musiva (strain SO2202) TaxID=692275 RepID=M3CYK6_SPHMS|nr:uncharacterized protein SEPMUDRAFT_121040 [Sphaerulina musiva SO2202]EMF09162.1 hypothetical protein SEPMUDRAFT_121040 [Sphaerulina musiva SO2202]
MRSPALIFALVGTLVSNCYVFADKKHSKQGNDPDPNHQIPGIDGNAYCSCWLTDPDDPSLYTQESAATDLMCKQLSGGVPSFDLPPDDRFKIYIIPGKTEKLCEHPDSWTKPIRDVFGEGCRELASPGNNITGAWCCPEGNVAKVEEAA